MINRGAAWWKREWESKCDENERLRTALDDLAEIVRNQADGGNDDFVNKIYERAGVVLGGGNDG